MENPPEAEAHQPARQAWFTTTHWSVVLAAGRTGSTEATAALDTLCRAYWRPLFGFVRRQGYSPESAEDLIQGFFARLIEKEWLVQADPQRGKFRSFLLAALKHFLADAAKREAAQKRGGGHRLKSLHEHDTTGSTFIEPAAHDTSENEFDRAWAFQLMDAALNRLRAEFMASGKERQFAELKPFLSGAATSADQVTAAARLDMTPGALSVAVHRLRRRYRQLVREQVARTVTDPGEIDGEMAWLFDILNR